MEIKEAKRLVTEMIELCQELGFGPLTITCISLFRELDNTESIEDLLSLSAELLMHADEVPFRDNDSIDILKEIAELNNKLQELAE